MYKFRAYCPKNKKYYYDHDEYNGYLCVVTNMGIFYNDMSKFEDDVFINQFTGLYDINSDEIYVNDILLVKKSYYGDYIAYIHFDMDKGSFVINNMNAKQISNPDRWDRKHPCIDSNGFGMDNTLIVGYSSNTGHRYKDEEGNYQTEYLIEVVGNHNEDSLDTLQEKYKREYKLEELLHED